MRIIYIILTIFTISGFLFARDNVLPIKNLDFEQVEDGKPAHWHWWSRSGDDGYVSSSDNEKRHGQFSALIKHEGEDDWAFVNRIDMTTEPGTGHQFSAWIKVDYGELKMSVVNMGNGEKLIGESSQSLKAKAGRQWHYIELINEIPAGSDQLDIRFSGKGPVRAWIDDVRVETHEFKEIATDKPQVNGFADQRVQETLDRGLVAMLTDEGHVYIGWRLLLDDPGNTAFHLYRRVGDKKANRLNKTLITQTTDFMDTTAPLGQKISYQIGVVNNGKERVSPQAVVIAADAKPSTFLQIKLDGNHTFQKAGIADLDGDGRYDFVIKQPHENIDPHHKYWEKSPETYKLEAYNANGEFMWRYDLGWAIERGIWYSPYIVYDFNGDGRAKVAVKTGEGDPRDKDGRVQTGPEYLTILDGQTGNVIAQTDWLSREPFYEIRKTYNYASRNQLGVAFLDGKTPCLIMARGTYNLMMATAFELDGSRLRELWKWDNLNMRRRYQGQGAHFMHSVDLDDDGRQEVTLGSLVLDDNGSILWSTGLGHPDHHYIGDIDPQRPGLEIYYGLERRQKQNGMCLVDARNGNILWGHPHPTRHVHSRGMCSDVISDYPGAECYSSDRDEERKPSESRLRTSKGKVIRDDLEWGFGKIPVYWDADPQRELFLDGNIQDYSGFVHVEQPEGRIVAVADILGDWREEIITSVEGEIRIYITTIPATDRHVCLMQDPLYRNDVALAAMGYYQVPMLSYDLASRADSLATTDKTD
jgi:rhamnogalacturonan endolyase